MLQIDWQTASAISQVCATVLSGIGIVVSVVIGIRTLREVQADRLYRVRPKLLFDKGGRRVDCRLEQKIGIPGIDPGLASALLRDRPSGALTCVANDLWGGLSNHGSGSALDSSITVFARQVCRAGEEFLVDPKKLLEFPYSPALNHIPAHPSHIPSGESAKFFRLPTPVTVDYAGQLSSMECVVLIRYRDLYSNEYSTWQELRVAVERREASAYVFLTFGEEIIETKELAALKELQLG
jgi:hypothetical protein